MLFNLNNGLVSNELLKKKIPNDIIKIIQEFNMTSSVDVEFKKKKVIKNIEKLKNEYCDALELVKTFGMYRHLSFFKYTYLKTNEEYHYKNIFKKIGQQRAKNILLTNSEKHEIYNKDMMAIGNLIHYTRTGRNIPVNHMLVNDFWKIEKKFELYLKDDYCYAVCKKNKKNYSMCNNKRCIRKNEKKLFCKTHINSSIENIKTFLKKNIHLIENYKIKATNTAFIKNYEK